MNNISIEATNNTPWADFDHNGLLKLTAKREPGDYMVWRWDEEGNGYTIDKYFEYTSGLIQTKMKFKYGLFEIRCKIPYGKGFWPAFWLFGGKGEIDIHEFGGDEPYRHAITLWKYPEEEGDPEMCGSGRSYGINFSSNFHTFSAEWDEFKIVYRVDGDIKRIDYKWIVTATTIGLYDCQHHVSTFYDKNPFFTETPKDIRLNLGISCEGCPFGGPPNSSTVFPSSYEIDYIRIYHRKNPTRYVQLCDIDYTIESSAITGNTIQVGGPSCNPVIENGQSLFLFANNRVTLLPNFWAKNGSNFLAKSSNVTGLKSTNIIYEENFKSSSSEPVQISSIYEESYKIFPNPNNGQFFIELNGEIENFQNIEVFDINGKIIYQNNDFPKIISIDLSKQSQGIYLIRITQKDKMRALQN